jgi:hypothetical protein
LSAAACVAGLIGLGVLVNQQGDPQIPEQVPAATPEPQRLGDPESEPPGLPRFQLGLQRVGVVEVPAGASATVALDQAAAEDPAPLFAAIMCDESTALTEPTVRAQVAEHTVNLDCGLFVTHLEVPAYPTPLPSGDSITVHAGAGPLTLAIYQQVPYQDYPPDAPQEYSLLTVTDSATTRVLRPDVDQPVADNTWQWDVILGDHTGLEIWTGARGRFQLSINGTLLDFSPGTERSPGIEEVEWPYGDPGWRDGWWVQWGTNTPPTIDLSPKALKELGIDVPESGRVTVRVLTQDITPQHWFLIVHGRGDAMPLTDSPHLPDRLPGLQLLNAVEVHPHNRDARVAFDQPVRSSDLRLAAVCPRTQPEGTQPQPMSLRTAGGPPITLTCTPGARPAELARIDPGDDLVTEVWLSGVVTHEQADGQVNLNRFPVHLGIYQVSSD